MEISLSSGTVTVAAARLGAQASVTRLSHSGPGYVFVVLRLTAMVPHPLSIPDAPIGESEGRRDISVSMLYSQNLI